MNFDPIEALDHCQGDQTLGYVARQASQFLAGTQFRLYQSSGAGQSSLSIARMYEIRRGLKNFRRSAFEGLEETISSLKKRDVVVHLVAIETEKGLVSIWFPEDSNRPVGIVIAEFE